MSAKILLCGCSSHHRVSYAKLRTFLSHLSEECELEIIPDLCGSAACHQSTLSRYAEYDYIVACHKRAVMALFNFADVELPIEKIIDLRKVSPKEALEQMGLFSDARDAAVPELSFDSECTPWNPVIDYDRCVNCGKCADFCLFGVYDFTAGEIKVANPQNCKTNCPACARVCPESAIIFPKYDKSPINGGEEIEENLPVDPSEIRKGNTYDKLANRRRSKRRLLKDPLNP